jgi:acetolactate synthase-1/2/3 large subunit
MAAFEFTGRKKLTTAKKPYPLSLAGTALLDEPLTDAPPQTMRGAKILCEALLKEGVDTIFGYPGGAVLHIYDELFNYRDKLRHVLVRHEQGAVHMAEGYAKSTGKVGVALVTSGPGATNAVTGIADAALDSVPLVVISGNVPRKMIGTDAFQEVDTVGITRQCTKYNYLVRDVNDLAEIVKEAFFIASSGRPGPVLIDIPKDVSGENAPFVYPNRLNLPSYRSQSFGDSEQVKKAVEMMCKAKMPILYVGGGVIHSAGGEELLELAEKLNLPVTPTLLGLGCFPSGHPLSLGMLGMHGTYWANMAISDADLIVAIGVRFDDRVTGALNKFAPQAEIIHVDIDPSSINKNRRVQVGIEGDAKTVMQQMLEVLPAEACATSRERLADWWQQIAEWKVYSPLTYQNSDTEIKPQYLVEQLYNLTHGDAIVSSDVGQHQMWVAQYYPFNGPRQWLTSGGLGTMGFGLPAALGAQIAHPDRQVVAFVGDGGFQMTAQELTTAVQYKTNLKVIIMNNGFLGMVRQWQEIFYDKTYSHVLMECQPDFVKLAEAYGATGLRVSKPEELSAVLEKGLNTPGVVVMDVVVSEEENVFPMVPAGAGLKEMRLS